MKNRNLLESFSHALDGIGHTIRNERNMRIHLVAAVLAICAAIIFKVSAIEYVMIFIAIGLVLICEIINTIVELIFDVLYKDYNENAKLAKDMAAGATLIAALLAVVVGIFIFGWRVMEWITKL
jgi:diacylglycerol kinase